MPDLPRPERGLCLLDHFKLGSKRTLVVTGCVITTGGTRRQPTWNRGLRRGKRRAGRPGHGELQVAHKLVFVALPESGRPGPDVGQRRPARRARRLTVLAHAVGQDVERGTLNSAAEATAQGRACPLPQVADLVGRQPVRDRPGISRAPQAPQAPQAPLRTKIGR